MAYTRSYVLRHWRAERRGTIDVLAAAHAQLGEVDGPGRPRETGRPIAHADVIRVIAEFQAFVRDLHDLAAEKLVELSDVPVQRQTLLTASVIQGRFIDRGNSDLRSLREDFRRLGITGLVAAIRTHDPRWETVGAGLGDQASLADLIAMRNALAHGNQLQLDALRRRGILDTVTWARSRLPGLNRIAGALDHVVWEHLQETFGVDPW